MTYSTYATTNFRIPKLICRYMVLLAVCAPLLNVQAQTREKRRICRAECVDAGKNQFPPPQDVANMARKNLAADCLKHPDAFPDFDGLHKENLKLHISFDTSGFNLAIFSINSKRASKLYDADGSIAIELRPGTENTYAQNAPVSFTYDMTRHPMPPPAKMDALGMSNEGNFSRTLLNRYHTDVPEYPSLHMRPLLPQTAFYPLDDGWMMLFRFSWHDFRGKIPFRTGKRPNQWRLIVTRIAGDGSRATLGNMNSPIFINWETPPAKFADEITRNSLAQKNMLDDYVNAKEQNLTFWQTHKQERHIIYVDPGIETFEPKNPTSDALFFEKRIVPFHEANKNLEDALLDGKAESLPDTVLGDVAAEVGRIDDYSWLFENLRRDYLLDRFMDRPVLNLAGKASHGSKSSMQNKANKAAWDELTPKPSSDDLIDLDEITF